MKKILFIITCILISGMAMQSCKQSDGNLKKEVDKEIAERYNSTISTSVKDGVVTLTGTVESEQEKTSIQSDVEAVGHVKTVVNNISVNDSNIIPEEPVINSGDTIKSTIESKLETEGFKDVKVDIHNGDVVLSGDLKRSDLTKVMQIVNESSSGKVTNNLKLK
ncbi:BON domain-containing protein [Dysgonomonas sp.]|uniref:BON domain-containing protein n=1 Tax=Dysgonomonas TaxID=156973 RepID=UPI0027BA72D3|nr:BON domain-containing protein [Dysgonomonas sp.]